MSSVDNKMPGSSNEPISINGKLEGLLNNTVPNIPKLVLNNQKYLIEPNNNTTTKMQNVMSHSMSCDNNSNNNHNNNHSALNNNTNNNPDFIANSLPSDLNEAVVKKPILKKRNRLYASVQQKNYGPKATLKKVTDEYLLLIQDPLSQQLSWTKAPLYILVIKKICNTLFEPFIEILKYLIYNHNMIVYVEEADYDNELFRSDEHIRVAMSPRAKNEKPSLRKFSKLNLSNHSSSSSTSSGDVKNDTNKIDLIICLGGDGTLLHVSTLFQQSCPPVLSIHMGSLGFLCPFDFDNYRDYINGVIKGGVPLLLRNRLKCRLEKTYETLNESSNLNESSLCNSTQLNELSQTSLNAEISFNDADQYEWLCLNEVVVSRGPSPFLSNLDLYINDYLITTVQGDGLIISTPTGSTAYAMAAGASMSHPSVPAIIIAPICPHSLSFRPIVVPAGVELKIALSVDARHTAWYSVDGRNTNELKPGYYLSITASEYPLPSVCRSDQVNDWFEGLAMCLHWNQRQKQLPLNSCYMQSQPQSLTHSLSQSQLHSSFSSKSSSTSSFKQTLTIPAGTNNGFFLNTSNNTTPNTNNQSMTDSESSQQPLKTTDNQKISFELNNEDHKDQNST